MISFFNQKAWLYSLSLTILASSIFAQDNNASTNLKVTNIEKITHKDSRFFVNNTSTEKDKDVYSYSWGFNTSTNDPASKKPQLGILLKENASDLIVLKTFPNTAASEIGLQEDDKIISIDGKKVESIAQLIELIQSHQVNDIVVVKYERNGLVKTSASILRASSSKHHYSNARRNYNYSNFTTSQKENACEELEKIYGKPFLGVHLSNPHVESGNGAKLISIIKGTGAEAAILQANDRITKMNETPISCSKEAMKFIQNKQPGDQIIIQVVREYKTMLIKATLGSWADSPNYFSKINKLEAYCEANKLEEQDMQENACERLEEIYGKPFLGVYFDNPYVESGNGAKLNSIIKGTSAETAVLKAEDKITKMNETPISCSKEAMKFIQNKQPGDLIQIQFLRAHETMLIDVTLGSWADSPKSASTISKLETYCKANTTLTIEEVAPKENKTSFETQAVMEVFPNPTADFVTIRFEGQKTPLAIQIIGLNGQTMYTKNIQNFDGNYNDQLDLSKYPSGVYLINLTQSDQQMTQQVVVE